MNEDKILVERLRENDRTAFEALFKKYYPSFCLVAYRYVEDKDAAKDITQDVFIKFWDKRNEYEDIPSVKTFLYVLVKNASLNYIRSQKIKDKHLSAIEREGELFFHQVAIPEETFRQLEATIEKLPPQSANIMRLVMQGYSNMEIAEQLGVSVNTVKTLKYNAVKNLRNSMDDVSLATVILLVHAAVPRFAAELF